MEKFSKIGTEEVKHPRLEACLQKGKEALMEEAHSCSLEMDGRKKYVFQGEKYVFSSPIYVFPSKKYIFISKKYLFLPVKYIFLREK